jgi:hypothetical protein
VLHPLEGASERDGLRRVGEPVAPGVGDGYVLEERLLHLAATADLRRLRDAPYLLGVLRRPRVWVFGSEERLQVV